MGNPTELRTPRLLLRQWRATDYDDFAALNADAEVMAEFPATLSRAESDALASRCQSELQQRGWGVWALERLEDGQFIGMVGLNPFQGMPFGDGVEVLWRLLRSAWGQGFATEAAGAALKLAFTDLALDDVVAFTTVTNQRSIAVMQRLGMQDCQCNFLHPGLPASHPLSRHVLYRLIHDEYVQQQNVEAV